MPRCRSLAEVDGNRTRRTGITRPTRFEGGGAHQVPGHLLAGNRPGDSTSVATMKKLLLLVVIIALGAVAAKKLRVE